MPPRKLVSTARSLSPKVGKTPMNTAISNSDGKSTGKEQMNSNPSLPRISPKDGFDGVPSNLGIDTILLGESQEDPMDLSTKSDKFLDCLQHNGVRMAFVRSLVALYEEDDKPDEPLPYICGLLGKGLPSDQELFEKQKEVEELRSKFMELQEENGLLRYRLSKYILPENPGEGGEDFDFGFDFNYDPRNYSYLNINNSRNGEEDDNGNEGDNEESAVPTAKEEENISVT